MADTQIKVEFGDSITTEHHAATADVGLYVAGTKVVGAQDATGVADLAYAATLTDADASLGATTQAEIEAVLVAIKAAVNGINDVLIAHGLMIDADA